MGDALLFGYPGPDIQTELCTVGVKLLPIR